MCVTIHLYKILIGKMKSLSLLENISKKQIVKGFGVSTETVKEALDTTKFEKKTVKN